MMLAASFFNAHVFSEIVILIDIFVRDDQYYLNQLEVSYNVFIEYQMPFEIRSMVLDFFHLTQETRLRQ